MPDKLPKGWVKTTLGEIAEPSRARALPTEFPTMRYVGLEHIETQSMRLLGHGYAREVRSSSVRFSKGDVLYGKMRPYLNKVWVAEFDGLCSAEFLVFPKRTRLDSQFLAARLNAEDFVAFANGQVSGERPRVDFEKLSRFPVLLPPAVEQEKIMAKVNAALFPAGRAETAARRAKERLQGYRDAVLHAAATGELTRTTRESQRKKDRTETGEALLQRFLAIRRARWEESELERLRSVGKKPKDDRWKSLYPAPSPPSSGSLPNLPEGWTWVSVDQLTSLVTSGSRGWKAYYSDDGAIFIRSQDIRTDKLDLSEVAHVRPPKASEGMRAQIKPGDLLMTITGANVGKAAVVDTELTEAYVSQHVGLIRFVDARLARFAHIYITSPQDGRRRLLVSAYGAGKPGLNLETLRELPIPLPPIAEQSEIAREVDRRLSAAKQLATTLEQQLDRARATRHLLLREAFAGHLVQQNAEDEHASVLLQRIRAAREAEAQRPKSKRMSKSKSEIRVAGRRNLLAVLKENGGPMTPEELFKASGHSQESVDQFFAELRELTATPTKIKEERRAEGVTLLRAVR